MPLSSRLATHTAAILFGLLGLCATLSAQDVSKELQVGLSGTAPFVIEDPEQPDATPRGISVEVWNAAASQAGWTYKFVPFENVARALDALALGDVDLVVGPISITAERIQEARFTLPYMTSSLGILSRTETPSLYERLAPFFTQSFFYAVLGFIAILTLVGTIVWLAERRVDETHFPRDPVHGIGNGIWFAIVTMSTVGYGDLSPKTVIGRIATGSWIVISLVMATSLVAGIASTLTISSMSTTSIQTAEELRGHRVATVTGSPGEDFARRRGATPIGADNLQDAYDMLIARSVDAVVFDRPQLQYFVGQLGNNTPQISISPSEYERTGYGFALPLNTTLQHELNVRLVELDDDGIISQIISGWLGEEPN